MRPISITIIIPAFNEEKAIKETIDRLKSLSKKENWISEIIVVNDGSTDNTSSIAKSLGVTVIDHPANGGYGLSLQHGIKIAKHDLIAITDADGTYPVEKLSELVKMVEEKGFDMAVGERQGIEYRKGLWKYPARIAFKLLAEFVAGRRIPDINSGFRVMKREKLLPHYERTCFGFSFTTSITLIFSIARGSTISTCFFEGMPICTRLSFSLPVCQPTVSVSTESISSSANARLI